MSKRLKAHVPYLHVLVNGNSKQREGILRGANKDLIYCVCECALNVLQGNVHLLPTVKNTLKKYKQRLRDLADKKISLRKKRQVLLRQRGGWISALIAPVLTSLAGVLFKNIEKKSWQ